MNKLFFVCQLSFACLAAHATPLKAVESNAIPGEYLVVVDLKKEGLAKAVASLRLATGGEVDIVAASMGVLKVTLPPTVQTNGTEPLLVAQVSQLPGIEVVEPNRMLKTCVETAESRKAEAIRMEPSEISTQRIPTDEHFGGQWYLHTIEAPEAWERRTDSDVIVAVLDTGFWLYHDDLIQRWWSAETSGNGIDDDGNGYIDDVLGWDFWNDDNSPMCSRYFDLSYGATVWETHGTHVAGIIGAQGNNGYGTAGICWDVKMMPLQVGLGRDVDLSAVAEAVAYAVDNGAQIINCSFGGEGSEAIHRAYVRYARDRGVLVVCAAGNSGYDISSNSFYPAALDEPNQITVAATDSIQKDTLAPFSNFHPTKVHLAAPGVHILAPAPSLYETRRTSDWYNFDGTSMASPVVAGVAALAWGQNLSLDYSQLREVIFNSVDRFPALNARCLTVGRVNARKAVSLATPILPPEISALDPVGPYECDGEMTQITLSAWVSDGNGDLLTVKWTVNGTLQSSEVGVKSNQWVYFSHAFPHGESQIGLTVSDGRDVDMDFATVTVEDTEDPIVVFSRNVEIGVDAGKSYASTNRLPRPQIWDACDPHPTVRHTGGTRLRLGRHFIEWHISDEHNNKAVARQRVTVTNKKPVANAGRPIRVFTSRSHAQVRLSGLNSRDPDGHRLSYYWSAPRTRIQNPNSKDTFASFPIGSTLAKLTVIDALGASSADTVRVVVKRSRQGRSANEAMADQFASLAYFQGYMSFAGRAYNPTAEDAYYAAERAYLLGAYAQDSDSDLRSAQAITAAASSLLFRQAYHETGDFKAIEAAANAYYGSAFAQLSADR